MKRICTGGIAVALGLGGLALLAPAAGATRVSVYHPSRWHAAVSYGPGLCVPNVNCPAVTNTQYAHGGPGGRAYLRTKLSSLTGVAAESRGIWQSAPFRYRGARGKHVSRLSLRLARRSRVAALLDVVGNSASYTADIVRPGGTVVTPINHKPIEQGPNWTVVNVRPHPGALKIGHRYAIRITTEFKTGVDVFPSATADYSGVLLRAVHRTHKRGRGRVAILHHNRLRIRVRCPRKYRPGRCKVRTVAVVHRRGPAITRAGHARVRAGHRRLVTMRVRHRYVHWVKAHKHVLVRERVRAHHKVHRFYRHLRIVSR